MDRKEKKIKQTYNYVEEVENVAQAPGKIWNLLWILLHKRLRAQWYYAANTTTALCKHLQRLYGNTKPAKNPEWR